MLLEERDDGRVVVAFCDVQRCLTVLRRPIDVRAFVQQKPDHFDVTIFTPPTITDAVKWRLAVLRRPVDIRAVVQQQPRRVDVAVVARPPYRRTRPSTGAADPLDP
jgi:hypothetical protein